MKNRLESDSQNEIESIKEGYSQGNMKSKVKDKLTEILLHTKGQKEAEKTITSLYSSQKEDEELLKIKSQDQNIINEVVEMGGEELESSRGYNDSMIDNIQVLTPGQNEDVLAIQTPQMPDGSLSIKHDETTQEGIQLQQDVIIDEFGKNRMSEPTNRAPVNMRNN